MTRKAAALTAGIVLLVALTALSLGLGAQPLSPGRVWSALAGAGDDTTRQIVVGLRVPRTVVALVAGAALGMAGAVMQGVTRNPLADPGLLGLNAGASLGVVIAIAILGVTQTSGYLWFALLGAGAAGALVYGVGSRGGPTRFAIAGAAVTAALTSIVNLVLLADEDTYERFRFWSVGSVAAHGLDGVGAVWPLVVAGAALALVGGRMLNVLALGDDAARGLGLNVPLARAVCAVAVVLLAGSATAIAGPIMFVGLMAVHAARAVAGADYRWTVGLAAVVGAAALTAADLVGRFVAPPGELEAGIVAAVAGAPLLIALVRRRRMVAA